MLNLLLLSSVLASPPQAPTAKDLIERVLLRYSQAKTLEGTIATTQSAQGLAVTTQTRVAYERPSKIILEQVQGGSKARRVWMVSDGKQFRYSTPDRLMTQDPYLREAVNDGVNKPQTISDMYSVIASGLPDRSPILDLLIARVPDMKFVSRQFSTLVYGGRTQLAGREVHAIAGDWRESDFKSTMTESAAGKFELYVDDSGDIVRYVLRQKFAVPTQFRNGRPISTSQEIDVTTTWDATVAVNTAIDPSRFAMRSR